MKSLPSAIFSKFPALSLRAMRSNPGFCATNPVLSRRSVPLKDITGFSGKRASRGFTPTPTLSPFRFLKSASVGMFTLAHEFTTMRNHGETKKLRQGWCRGFTLVEMIVSLGLFTVILFVATSAFLSIVSVDRKSRVVRIATDNMNLTLEDMSRRISTGSKYFCGSADTGGVADCPAGGTSFFFTSQELTRMHYSLGLGVACGTDYQTTQGCIIRDDLAPMPVTSPEINIKGLKFVVSGSAPFTSGDRKQPMVVIVIDGEIVADTQNPTQKTAFKLQTTVTQRAYDN